MNQKAPAGLRRAFECHKSRRLSTYSRSRFRSLGALEGCRGRGDGAHGHDDDDDDVHVLSRRMSGRRGWSRKEVS